MNVTSRARLAVLLACMASAGAVTPAAAQDAVPVQVPLEGLEALPVEAPELRSGVPLPVTGAPDGPHSQEGKLIPESTLPQVPFRSSLPRTVVDAPVADPLSRKRITGVTVDSPDASVRTTSPGMGLDAPLKDVGEGLRGLPKPKAPHVAVQTPTLKTAPKAAPKAAPKVAPKANPKANPKADAGRS